MQRFYEIAEKQHRIQNPLSLEQLMYLGEICQLEDGQRVLDLSCGKGELLVQWARNYGIVGVGVDASGPFVDAAKQRAYLLDVGDRVNFIMDNVDDYPQAHHEFDLVSYLGRDWLGDAVDDRLRVLRMALKPGAMIVIGETYWRQPPTDGVCTALQVIEDEVPTLAQILELVTLADFELVEMVLPTISDTDRYESRQWMAVDQFLMEHPNDRDAADLRLWMHKNRRLYLTYGRDYLGWGAFILRDSLASTAPMNLGGSRSLENSDRPVRLDYDAEMIWVSLHDGRIIGNPLSWYPWLIEVGESAQRDVELHADSLYWPDLQQRLHIATMLRGRD